VAQPAGTDNPRRAGRPRRSARPVDGNARAEILAVAARLFSERGVVGTSMAEIASRSGLQQSSLYYYFRNKQQLLDELVAEANRAPLALVTRVRADGGPAAVQLYRIVRADVMALCALPYDLNEVHRVAARDHAGFARYWRERGRLLDRVTEVISEGVASGDLRPVDPRLTALTVLSNDEATQNWMRGPGPGRRAASRGGAVLGGPHVVGAFLADLIVRSLLVDPDGLDDVRREADRLDASAVLEP
jgi:AcrR family transcriptional regulator